MIPQRNIITSGVTFLVFIFISINVFTQGNSNGNANSNNNANGNALKWETQGNNADTSHFIGTTNPIALKMRTNNVERLRITEDGKFGIGISNPLEKFELQGNLKLSGDIIFSDYADLNDTTDKFILVDEQGRTMTKSLTNITSSVYSIDCYEVSTGDPNYKSGTVGLTLPSWANRIYDDKQILYTGTTCPTWVGIGTDEPVTILDVRGDFRATKGIASGDVATPEAALHIQNFSLNSQSNFFDHLIIVQNENGEKVLQLNNDGLLRAREIKVDEQVWPDYVFEADYDLMSIQDLKIYIEQHGHLPNVPAAEEVTEEGVNLGETARITMEKVEELTLYVIDQQEQINEQQEQIQDQQKLLEEQRELLEAQRKLLEEQQNQLQELK